MSTYITIKSYKPGQNNWDGTGFSNLPAKIYTSFEDATRALESYWFGDAARELNPKADHRAIKIVHLTEEIKNLQLAYGKIRW